MNSVFIKAFKIKKENGWFINSLFFHQFFIGAGLALFFLASNALFLSEVSAENLPFVYLFTAIIYIVTGRLYNILIQVVKKEKLFQIVILGMFLLIFFMYFGTISIHKVWYLFFLMVMYRIVYLMFHLESFGLSSLLFDLKHSSSLLGWTASGDLPGRFIGYLSITSLLIVFDLPTIILVSACFILISFFFLNRILKKPEFSTTESTPTMEKVQLEPEINVFKFYFGDKYLRILSLLSAVIALTAILIDFSFINDLQLKIRTSKGIAEYLGYFFSIICLATFIIKFVFSKKVVGKIGIRTALYVLPVMLTIVSVLIFYFNGLAEREGGHSLLHFGALALIFMVFKYSLNEPVFISLFEPLIKLYRLPNFIILKTVIEPVGILMAALLLIFTQFNASLNFYELQYFLLASIGIWLLILIINHQNFIKIFESALEVRSLEGPELAIKDKDILQILESKLEANHSEAVIYSIELLHRFDPSHIDGRLTLLLSHPSEEVQIHVIEKIKALKLETQLDNVLDIIRKNGDVSPKVKAAAIKTFSILKKEAIEEINLYLEDSEPPIQRAAILSLLQFGTEDQQIKAKEKLSNLISSFTPEDQILSLEIIEELNDCEYCDVVLGFLENKNERVVRKAVLVCGKLHDSIFIPFLISMIKGSGYYNEAIISLVQYKENALPLIKEEFGMYKHTKERFMLRLCKVCGQIGGDKASEILWWVVKFPWLDLKIEALNALKIAGFEAKLKEDYYQVTDQLEKLFRQIFWLHNAIMLLNKKRGFGLLLDALQKELEEEKKKIKTLLSFLFVSRPDEYKEILHLLGSIEKEDRLKVIETLSQMLPASTVEKLIVVLNGNTKQIRKTRLSRYYSDQLLDEITVVFIILQGEERESKFSRWTQATALYSLAGSFYPSLLKAFIPYLESNDLLFSQAAGHTIIEFCKDRFFKIGEFLEDVVEDSMQMKKLIKKMENQQSKLLEIEKVIILKSTSIFSETPENVLIDIATIITEERVSEGTEIFKKGDRGDCMYIIYEGQVKIHIDNYPLNTLVNRDFFGELGLLDENPRSASAMAEKNTLLLRLDQVDFYELMAQRPEVAKGILQVLCNRIRAQDAMITDLQKNRKLERI
ncbi:cyclic nucleotide-binding domain-containing protein [Flexithrix dorotheae]|uniref:cyclic nucleotide-binding domain-containing protein n=1 Tax=Flexithrix dorotheae TaxID=70993 RepID=UPI00036EF049|nr:cyclic nucleotide-binding domain-containing protein [Flexithrix dorotheae]